MFKVGILYRLNGLLEFVKDNPILESELLRSFTYWHGVSTPSVLSVVYLGGWASKSPGGGLHVTESGVSLLQIPSARDRLRETIKQLVQVIHPAWTNLAVHGRKTVSIYAPGDVVQCLDEAGLLEDTDPETVRWWDWLASAVREGRDEQMLATGREGERLSIDYERERTGFEPEWVALNASDAGFDLLSRVEPDSTEKLLIEVKCSRSAWPSAELFISKNEWTVLSKARNACLHLWSIQGTGPLLAVVPIGCLAQHIPADQGCGSWQDIRLPFQALSPPPISVEPNRGTLVIE